MVTHEFKLLIGLTALLVKLLERFIAVMFLSTLLVCHDDLFADIPVKRGERDLVVRRVKVEMSLI